MSAAFYVEDANGDRFLFTIADAEYEPRFRAHARQWLSWRTSVTGRRHMEDRGVFGHPVKPCRVIVDEKP